MQIQQALLKQLRVKDLQLAKEGDSWQLAGIKPDEQAQKAEPDKLLRFIGGVTVTKVFSKENPALLANLKPELTIEADTGAQQIHYAIYKTGHAYLLNTNLRKACFEIPAYQLEKLKSLDRKILVKPVDSKEDGKQAGQR